ncbi:MAG: aminotransferase class V-fold PLP-dependent enzyme, partial [Chthoniobacteraceae bacterium]
MQRPELSPFRRHWSLSKDIVFLNHGSFGACPIPIQRKQAELRAQMEAEPVQFLWRHYEDRLEPSRQALAEFIGARPADVVFVNNATTGVNSVVRSIRWRDGDEILTTSCDYNACRNALAAAVRDTGARIVVADIPFPVTSDDEIVEAILRRVTAKTRLAMIDYVTSNTARIFPIERIVRELGFVGRTPRWAIAHK